MAERQRRLMKKGDWILLLAVAAAAALFVLAYRLLYPPVTGGTVEITVNGAVYGVYALTDARSLTIESDGGGVNRLDIRNGTVQVADANCPDRLCMRRGAVSRQGETIVCLPHRLVITVRQGEEGAVDFISG